jgi:hypothetical protein
MATRSTQESYRYSSLTQTDSIRLIELQPSADKTAAVECNLIHTTLNLLQEDIFYHYTALSYVWGDVQETATVVVSGQLLEVTASLDCALKHLRDEKRILLVWADGICINQRDIGEKNQQVVQMGRIYKCAHHTVIFLGPGDAAAELVFSQVVARFNGTIDDQNYEKTLITLQEILESPWFYRVWVFQELVMSPDPKVQYRYTRCSWEKFCALIRTVAPLPNKSVEGFATSRLVISSTDISPAKRPGFDVVLGMQSTKHSYE